VLPQWFSKELRHEIILMNERECAEMSEMRRVRCGRPPDHLIDALSPPCRAALHRMENCHHGHNGRFSMGVAAHLGGKNVFQIDCRKAESAAKADAVRQEILRLSFGGN
jgi:hypothetical protein